MKFYSLASGSSGNCFFIDNGSYRILIDVGISYNQIKQKLDEIGYSLENIDFILITHTHNDHIKSLNSFSMSKVYSGVKLPGIINLLEKNKVIELGNYKIYPFPLSHDVECCGYKIISNEESLIYLTDTGYVNYKVLPHLKNATYYIFESNHDINMLMNSKRPSFLKTRILSDIGHLSNDDASEILMDSVGEKTKEIYLAHISRDCNTKELAYKSLISTFNKNSYDYSKLIIKALDKEEIMQGGELYEEDCLIG